MTTDKKNNSCSSDKSCSGDKKNVSQNPAQKPVHRDVKSGNQSCCGADKNRSGVHDEAGDRDYDDRARGYPHDVDVERQERSQTNTRPYIDDMEESEREVNWEQGNKDLENQPPRRNPERTGRV